MESLKLQIRMVNELLEKKGWQNEAMKKHLKSLQNDLERLENEENTKEIK